MSDIMSRLLEAWRQDMEREWALPSSPCPSEEELRGYFQAVAEGRVRQAEEHFAPRRQAVAEGRVRQAEEHFALWRQQALKEVKGQRYLEAMRLLREQEEVEQELAQWHRIADHVFACKTCYQRLWNWTLEGAEEQVREETRVLVGNENNVKGLIGVLQDASRPGWVRALAVDHLAELGGSEALAALQQAQSDPDEEVRKAAEEALERMGFFCRLAAWLKKSIEEVKGILQTWAQVSVPAPAVAFAQGGAREMGMLLPRVRGIPRAESVLEGVTDDERVHWEIGFRSLRLWTEEENLKDAKARLFLFHPGEEEPRWEEEVSFRPVPEGRYGASVSLPELQEGLRLAIVVLKERPSSEG